MFRPMLIGHNDCSVTGVYISYLCLQGGGGGGDIVIGSVCESMLIICTPDVGHIFTQGGLYLWLSPPRMWSGYGLSCVVPSWDLCQIAAPGSYYPMVNHLQCQNVDMCSANLRLVPNYSTRQLLSIGQSFTVPECGQRSMHFFPEKGSTLPNDFSNY